MINLSQQEIEKFTLWLEQEADSNDAVCKQMMTLNTGAGLVDLIQRNKVEAAAYRIVARRFRSTEQYAIKRLGD